jgi:hypothetical protein
MLGKMDEKVISNFRNHPPKKKKKSTLLGLDCGRCDMRDVAANDVF